MNAMRNRLSTTMAWAVYGHRMALRAIQETHTQCRVSPNTSSSDVASSTRSPQVSN